MGLRKTLRTLWQMKKMILSLLTPVFLLPVLYNVDGDPGRCAYGVCILIVFWVFELLPLPITSLLPVLLFPSLGVITARQVCAEYTKDATITVIGIFCLVAAVERWGLHRRMALGILLLFGTKPHWLILGMLVCATVLSMFITAGVAVLMLPIVRTMVDRLKHVETDNEVELDTVGKRCENPDEEPSHDYRNTETTDAYRKRETGDADDTGVTYQVDSTGETGDVESTGVTYQTDTKGESGGVYKEAVRQHEEETAKVYKAMCLCIAYGTTLGASATLTGSPSNFVMLGLTEEFYRTYGIQPNITFVSWLVFACPVVIIIVVLTWIWFVIFFLRGKGLFRRHTVTEQSAKSEERVRKHLRAEYKSLGPWSYQEIVALVFLLLLVVLFVTQDLYFVPGWISFLKDGYVGSSAPTALLVALLFITPCRSPKQLLAYSRDHSTDYPDSRFAPMITWADVNKTLPWGVLLLLGAAFALVKASQEFVLIDSGPKEALKQLVFRLEEIEHYKNFQNRESGLTNLIGVYFEEFAQLEPWLLTLVVTTMTTFLTEFISNSAAITMLLPIVGQVAILAGLDPMALIFPLTLAAKFAFMMPIATPPNAIVYSLGALRVKDMAAAGFVLNILSLITLNVAAHTWGKAYFRWDILPEAMRPNSTLTRS